MKSFNFAQTFVIDPAIGNKITVNLTGIDLFWMYKPDYQNNISGLMGPGITIYVVNTKDDLPDISGETFANFARVEWGNIITSSDGSVATRFRFNKPLAVNPGKKYAILVSYDGNETFFPWVAKRGMKITNSTNVFPGNFDFIGNYYESVITDGQVGSLEPIQSWRALTDTQLKFRVYIARYMINGVPVSNSTVDPSQWFNLHGTSPFSSVDGNNVIFSYPSPCIENISFDLNQSTVQSFVGSQRVYQNTVFYPGGYQNGSSYVTVSAANSGPNSTLLIANTKLPNGANFKWSDIFSDYAGTKYVTVFDTELTNIRKVQSIISNTVIQVDEPFTFTNTISKFLISPIATIDSFNSHSPEGKSEALMFLTHSNANDSVRFVNNVIEAVTVTAGGLDYSNNDVLYVTGFEYVADKVTTGYFAVGNIVTNSIGGISEVYLSNTGCGFTNSSALHLVIANSIFDPGGLTNSTANTSLGSGATFEYTIGATLQSELSNNIFKDCEVLNLDLHDVTPFFNITSPVNTTQQFYLNSQYYIQDDEDVILGSISYVNPNTSQIVLELNKRKNIVADKIPCFVSYSNEFGVKYSNGATNDKVSALNIYSNNYMLGISISSNNDFVMPTINSTASVEFGKYVINNDYTNEHTNQGNAFAKHLTTLVNFDRFSEDVVVYLDAYRPVDTDIQVYARIQNNQDTQAFDDEDWTRLEIIDGVNIYSSSSKEDDYIELTYGFQGQPNTSITLDGTITTTNNSSTLTGSNTTFSDDLANNDVIKIYDPYFPNTNFMVASVNNITNNTSLTIDTSVLSTINTALVGNGLKVDLMGYKHQAFNNIQFDNVVRYYNESMVKFDGYDKLQLKVVFLSSNLLNIPKVHNIKLAGVSA